MNALAELIAALTSSDGEHPEDMFDQITAAHGTDMDTANARVVQGDTDLAAAMAEIAALKAHNYDLLMAIPSSGTPGADAEIDNDDNDDTDNIDEADSLESALFVDKDNA